MSLSKKEKTVHEKPPVESACSVEDERPFEPGEHIHVEFGNADDIQAMMEKYDRESNVRIMEGVPKKLMRWFLVGFSLFCVYMNLIAMWDERTRRASFVGLLILMAFSIYPISKKTRKRTNYIPWYDVVLGLLGSGSFFSFVINVQRIVAQAGRISTIDVVIGAIGIIILLEACRRSAGLPIVVVAAAFIIYSFTVKSVDDMIFSLFYTTEGVLGTPINVCSTFIVLFIIFGAFLERTGIADFFIQAANSVVGGASGGPAKVAVVASALEGMVSGSSVANTVGSGSVTIPLMKRTG